MNGDRQVHEPVLKDELLELLDLEQSNTVIDATLGLAGHARAVLQRLGSSGTLIGIERDPEILDRVPDELKNDGRVELLRGNFANLIALLQERAIDRVDAIYFDLGLNSYHLDHANRGFTYKQPEQPLDLRFNPESGQSSAADLINNSTRDELRDILVEWGEVRSPSVILDAIERVRPVELVGDLVDALDDVLHKPRRFHGEVTRVFQALRIAVNEELEHLRSGLEQAMEVLDRDGRLAVISFHSLEDRIAKHFFREQAKDCVCPPELPVCACDAVQRCEVLTQSPLQPGKEEMEANSRSRPAKLRAVKRV
ncbi:MAG: 16S rRNA (cytosine(1402)-N(4))-methyltransferase RsmH [bacterium]